MIDFKKEGYSMIESLRIFLSVVEKKSFSRAAEEHHLSQPGVSLTIRNLEEVFQVQLLHRSPKYVELTRAGEILYQHGKEILRHYEDAKEEIYLLKNVVMGSLKIGASFTVGEYLVPGILARFMAKYPSVESQVWIGNTEEVAEWVKNGQIHIGLVEGDVQSPDLKITPFMEDEMIIIMPGNHPLAKERYIRWEELQNQIWVLREKGSGTRTYGDLVIEEHQLQPRKVYEFSSNQGVKEGVIAGLGFSIISHLTVRKEIKTGEISTVAFSGEKHNRWLSFLQPKNSLSRVTEAFIIEVRNAVKKA